MAGTHCTNPEFELRGINHLALVCRERCPSLDQRPLQARSGACHDGQRRVRGVSTWPAGEEGRIR
jgi:hypothetical protein